MRVKFWQDLNDLGEDGTDFAGVYIPEHGPLLIEFSLTGETPVDGEGTTAQTCMNVPQTEALIAMLEKALSVLKDQS